MTNSIAEIPKLGVLLTVAGNIAHVCMTVSTAWKSLYMLPSNPISGERQGFGQRMPTEWKVALYMYV